MARIPLIGPRARYMVLNESPTWLVHKMAVGNSLTGEAPATSTAPADQLDPEVGGGFAKWLGLTKGGLFTMVGNYKKPMVVEGIVPPSGAYTAKLVTVDGDERAMPTTLPFKVAPGEYIKVTGGDAGSTFAVLVREDTPSR